MRGFREKTHLNVENPKTGMCRICGSTGLIEKHHVHPRLIGSKQKRPRGRKISVCPGCHFKIHDNFSNTELREMSLERLVMSVADFKEGTKAQRQQALSGTP